MLYGFIYFIQKGESGPVKIGFSKDISKRKKQLQTGSDEKLNLIFSFPGTMSEERNLHTQLEKLKIRKQGEWFEYDPDLFKMLISQLKKLYLSQ